jgi:hypothetical protein
MTNFNMPNHPLDNSDTFFEFSTKAQSSKENWIIKAISLGTLTAGMLLIGCMGFSGLVQADGATNDTLACYKWSTFPRERINLNIRGGGPLSTSTEAITQRTRGIHGKHVGSCGRGTNAALVGVLVETETVGSHLGLYSAQSRGKEKFGSDDNCRSVSIECYSEEVTLTPTEWICESRNEFDVYHGQSKLTLVAIDTAPDDPLCGVFEDKDTFEDSNDADRGVASGMQAPRRR